VRNQPALHRVTSKILVVDDSKHFRCSAVNLLAARGYELLDAAADCEAALAAVARACPDGVLLDVNLPGPGWLRGGEVARNGLPERQDRSHVI
jgi:CheY-like chemotaxis protein